MREILVTGGTGFFGKSILDVVGGGGVPPSRVARITVLARRVETARAEWPGVEFVAGDVREIGNLDALKGRRFDWILHAATPARVDVSDAEMTSIIVDGTRAVLDYARRDGCGRLLYVSSGGVYGRGFTAPVNEETTAEPVTAYGKGKLVAERMCLASGLDTVIARCFAFVGRHLPRDAHFAIGNFIRDALVGAPIVIKGDGSPVRSYLYADDLVRQLWCLFEKGHAGAIYNIGSPEAVSIKELAHLVRDALGSRSEVRVLGERVPGAADYYVPDVAKYRALDPTPITPLAAAVVLARAEPGHQDLGMTRG